jgi:hypothetical protein
VRSQWERGSGRRFGGRVGVAGVFCQERVVPGPGPIEERANL